MKNVRDTFQDRAMVSVKVHPALKEYILAINCGSDIITPQRDSRLWGLVKMYLEPVPAGYKPVPIEGTPDCIRIALYRASRMAYSFPDRGTVSIHTLYRDYINETGQRVIARHLMLGFKQTFRAYMNGALSNNPDLDISEAIDEFCADYRIENERITIDMLRKDWYRFRLRCSAARAAVPVDNTDL